MMESQNTKKMETTTPTELTGQMANLQIQEGQQPTSTPQQPMMLYAVHIREYEYPCGNIFGIYTTRQLAEEAIRTMFPQAEAFDDHGVTQWFIFPNTNIQLRENASAHIVEFNANSWVKDSLNGCAGCMTVIYDE